jgi:flagellar hook-associated protein 3 FlgL
MRIASHTISDSVIRQIQHLNSEQAKYQTQVSTGQRVQLPEDDPASVGRVLYLQTQQRQVTQWERNSSRAQELAQSSYSSLNSLKTVSARAGELATLGAGALGSDAMDAYASEATQLIEHTLQIANAKFGEDFIFGGTAVDTAPFTATRDASGPDHRSHLSGQQPHGGHRALGKHFHQPAHRRHDQRRFRDLP